MRVRADWFGNIVVVLFLLAQAGDGVLTYVGVRQYGVGIEANPLIGWLMAAYGSGMALAGAKGAAVAFGIVLHRGAVHRLVAALALLYLGAAVLPWIGLLYLR